MPELKIYTVADLREWLTNNHPAEGLSERVIAPTRAWAIVHNPYVKDEDAIVAAIFEDGELAAYTASFPDMLDGKRVWWASTLYCYPKFTGKGYGLIVVGSLMEAHEPESTYDCCVVPETIEIFNHLGLQSITKERYVYSEKTTFKPTLRGKLSHLRQSVMKRIHPWPKVENGKYTLRYASYIDGEAYAFIKKNKGNDLWLREQDMYNWILRYPFKQGCVLKEVVASDCHYTSNMSSYEYKVVKVYNDSELKGVYVLSIKSDTMSVVYLYYEESSQDIVFTSILDHCIQLKSKTIITENYTLVKYIEANLYYPIKQKNDITLFVPQKERDFSKYTYQLGDGDHFV